jgi:hypothetical protein
MSFLMFYHITGLLVAVITIMLVSFVLRKVNFRRQPSGILRHVVFVEVD